LSKGLLRASQTLIDACILAFAFVLGFLVRFDGAPPAPMTGRLLLTGPYVIGFEYAVLVLFGVHRFSWRYIGLREISRIALCIGASSLVLLVSRIIAGHGQYEVAYLRHGVIPMGVLGVNFAASFLGVAGIRVARRMLAERLQTHKRRRPKSDLLRTVLVGAGEAGVLVARELAGRPDLSMRAVAFVDDDPRKQGTVIHGVPVLGTTAELAEICERVTAKQALITMANVSGSVIRRITSLTEQVGIPTKIVPGIYEIVGGHVNLSRIRNVAIEDLLGREPVQLDTDELASFVHGKVVMITGAGGSIGSELCRQLCTWGPVKLLLVEQAENALFQIHRELLASASGVEILPCVADVVDRERVRQLIDKHRPALIFHAAAHKHVPIMEANPGEAIKNNVFGTRTLADLASEHGVEAFVMISTDKAVNPSSVMGATKRAAELYVQALARASTTRFVTVRFGNVLDSAGSVVPIFRQQIAAGGPVTVTHPEMRRYFMTIPEACQLVLQAGAMGEGGEIFVLDMGEPVRIVDLARDLITLTGLRPGEDIEIVFSGMRPGEKLFEELSTDAEHADKTRHPKIFVGRLEPISMAEVCSRFDVLAQGIRSESDHTMFDALAHAVPEYSGRKAVASEPELQQAADATGHSVAGI
jgi:FlaA1/EpsC-like NDP-sugar epimerase